VRQALRCRGCSVGRRHPRPQGLALTTRVAKLRGRQRPFDLSPRCWPWPGVARCRRPDRSLHHTPPPKPADLPSASVALITLQFVCHELPGEATRAVLSEGGPDCVRGPIGVVALVDSGFRNRSDPGDARPLGHLCSRAPSPTWRIISARSCRRLGGRPLRRSARWPRPRHRVMVASVDGPLQHGQSACACSPPCGNVRLERTLHCAHSCQPHPTAFRPLVALDSGARPPKDGWRLPPACAVAITQAFASLDQRLQAGDDWPFLPPISGG